MRGFSTDNDRCLCVIKTIIDNKIKFNGCNIKQYDNFTIQLQIKEYMSSIKPINISKTGIAMKKSAAQTYEIRLYPIVAEQLIWVGCESLPQAALVGLLMQQKISKLTVARLVDVDKMIHELRNLGLLIICWHLIRKIATANVVFFLNSSFNISLNQIFGQKGVINELKCRAKNDITTYYIID